MPRIKSAFDKIATLAAEEQTLALAGEAAGASADTTYSSMLKNARNAAEEAIEGKAPIAQPQKTILPVAENLSAATPGGRLEIIRKQLEAGSAKNPGVRRDILPQAPKKEVFSHSSAVKLTPEEFSAFCEEWSNGLPKIPSPQNNGWSVIQIINEPAIDHTIIIERSIRFPDVKKYGEFVGNIEEKITYKPRNNDFQTHSFKQNYHVAIEEINGK